MLPRRQRVDRELFSLIFKKGTAFHSPSLMLKVLPHDGASRFAVVAEKKAARGAVERNRVRRRGYYALGKHSGVLSKGAAGIFFVKKKISFPVLESEMENLLSRAKLFR